MHPSSQPPADDTTFIIFLGLGFLIVGIIYIMPSIVAFRRNHPNRWIILVINIAFGGTVIGWGIALVWAMRAAHRVGSTSSGGESGLNLFINDAKKIQVVEPPAISHPSVAQELERLHDLLTRGAISQAEFDDLKANLLGSATRR
ncbi:superinfection immunity protein [Bradyrhizobium sp. dw_411]|uniref:superinfection immunity protein n=1 Tax=Bradyrhizobium sp. dw_411 TaxID=2720082 RepID=UPI001BCE15FD|nr:superinfection immunity protein [Bradyrhizobium sp. dw_411]